MDCISSSLRSFIQAEPDKRLMVCDFASIEARVLAWIAGQHDLVQVFREGGDVYKFMASQIYDVLPEDVSKQERQIGKISVLGLGYGMGYKNFVNACKVMGGVGRIQSICAIPSHNLRNWESGTGHCFAFAI